MSYPIIMLCGKAGSGKDTAANYLAETYNGQVISLSDPMKRLCLNLLKVDKDSLWGSSEHRKDVISPQTLKILFNLANSVRWELYRWLRTLEKGDQHFISQIADDLIMELRRGSVTSVRTLLQSIGTEWGRAVDVNIWIRHCIENADYVLAGADYDKVGGVHLHTGPYKSRVIIPDGRFRNEILAIKKIGGMIIKVVRPGAGIEGSHASETEQDSIPDSWFDRIVYNTQDVVAMYNQLDLAIKGGQ